MKTHRVIKLACELSSPYRVTDGDRFHLKDVDPGDTGSLLAGAKRTLLGSA